MNPDPSYNGVPMSYVLPVLWMTSRLAVMGATPKGGGCTVQRRPWAAWRYRGGVWCLWMLVLLISYVITITAAVIINVVISNYSFINQWTELSVNISRLRRQTHQHHDRHHQCTGRQRQPRGNPRSDVTWVTPWRHHFTTSPGSPRDVNDNPPKFDNAIYNVTSAVEEETGISKNNPKYLLTVCWRHHFCWFL